MTLLDSFNVDIILGDYGTSHARYLKDNSLLPIVQEHRRLLGARMMPLSRDDLTKRLSAGEYHVSKKIDGEFAVLVFQDDEALLLNPGGTVRVGLPFIQEASALLRKAGLKRAMVAGELYVVRKDGKRARVHDVGTAVANPEDKKALDELHFAAFDLLEPKPDSFRDATKKLSEIFGKGKLARPVEGEHVKSVNEVVERFKSWVEQDGHEGLVIRSDTSGSFKAKPKHTLDVALVGFAEGVDDRRGMVHDLLMAVMRDAASFHLLGRVGGGISDDERRALLSDLKDDVVGSEYAEVNSEHVAYQMVCPTRVIELTCLDLLVSTTRGAPIPRMVLGWDQGASRWNIVRAMPLVNVISPVFKRIRDDKQVRPDHVGLDQLDRVVPIPDAKRDAASLVLPTSQLLRREVYTKTMKGQVMVRKLVVWKTNKQDVTETFPAYVLHLTDYSPNRKTPMEREIRVSNDKEQLDAFWEELAKSKLGRGWAKA